MTKARTMAAKRARKALQAACPISGVILSAEPSARQRASQRDTAADAEAVTRALDRRCALMGWDATDANRARARDQRIGTLYGRLYLDGRLAPPEADADTHLDAYRGLEEYDRLTRRYRRIVLGIAIASDGDAPTHTDIFDAAALTRHWREAHAVIASDAAQREAALYVLGAWEGIPPADVAVIVALRAGAAGLALAAHFGLR